MGGLLRATHRRIARRLTPGARKRVAAIVPRRLLASYRRLRTDVYLVSFPTCGRTWLRVMLGRVHRRAERDPGVSCSVATHDDDAQWKAPEDVDIDKSRYRGTRVVLLVRDPRDVIVSLYHQRRGRHGGYGGTLAEFLHERVG